MMLFSGIMNAMFFMSIMSLMGITMNPAESAMVRGGEVMVTTTKAQNSVGT